MSAYWFRRAALAAVLGLGVWAGLARAHGYPPGVHPGMTEAPPGYVPPPPSPLRDRLQHRCGLGCWASFNSYGCGSLHSELAFIFGSCRTFFGEPCLSGPPPSPLPPWVNLTPHGAARGDGAAPAGGHHHGGQNGGTCP